MRGSQGVISASTLQGHADRFRLDAIPRCRDHVSTSDQSVGRHEDWANPHREYMTIPTRSLSCLHGDQSTDEGFAPIRRCYEVHALRESDSAA